MGKGGSLISRGGGGGEKKKAKTRSLGSCEYLVNDKRSCTIDQIFRRPAAELAMQSRKTPKENKAWGEIHEDRASGRIETTAAPLSAEPPQKKKKEFIQDLSERKEGRGTQQKKGKKWRKESSTRRQNSHVDHQGKEEKKLPWRGGEVMIYKDKQKEEPFGLPAARFLDFLAGESYRGGNWREKINPRVLQVAEKKEEGCSGYIAEGAARRSVIPSWQSLCLGEEIDAKVTANHSVNCPHRSAREGSV